jgi:hypothetical protein
MDRLAGNVWTMEVTGLLEVPLTTRSNRTADMLGLLAVQDSKK